VPAAGIIGAAFPELPSMTTRGVTFLSGRNGPVWLAVAVLACVFPLALKTLAPPEPLGADVPPELFSAARAERVHQAMRCRGFQGRFHTMAQFPRQAGNRLFLVVTTSAMLGLAWLEWLQ
jgi:hypothetical protein